MSRWFNSAAVEWVMYEAPRDLPPGPAWTLAVVASFAGADGRAAFPSAETIAKLTRRSKRQVQRDLDDLAARGLLVPGDPRAVITLRADQRPNVWDLPPTAREYVGRHRKRGDTTSSRAGRQHVIPSDSRGDISAVNGVTKATERDDTMSPEEFLKNSGKGAAPADGGTADGDAPEGQNPPRAGIADPEALASRLAALKADLATKRPVTGPRPAAVTSCE